MLFADLHRDDMRDHALIVLAATKMDNIMGKRSPPGVTIETVAIDNSISLQSTFRCCIVNISKQLQMQCCLLLCESQYSTEQLCCMSLYSNVVHKLTMKIA